MNTMVRITSPTSLYYRQTSQAAVQKQGEANRLQAADFCNKAHQSRGTFMESVVKTS